MNTETSITRRAAFLGALALPATMAPALAAPPIPAPRPSGAGTIAALFREWEAIRNEPVDGLTEAQSVARWERYATLQRAMARQEPTTAAELAMMVIAETDDGDSEYRNSFLRKVRRIARGGAAMSNKLDNRG